MLYYCTKALKMEMTVNREFDNYMKQIFKTCEKV